MGEPKALIELDGAPLAARAAAALQRGGAQRVVLVGASDDVAAGVGLPVVADDRPGEGPLAGVATALAWASRCARDAGVEAEAAVLVVAACDQPDLSDVLIAGLIAAVAEGAEVAVGETADGRRHPLPTAWRVDRAAWLERLVEEGARRADAPLASLDVASVATTGRQVADLDTPEQVASRRSEAP
jgi:molybdopterin-guanine dinucleotide biosynthesis protein A